MCLREQMQFCVMAFVAMTLFPMLFISGCDSFVFITLTTLIILQLNTKSQTTIIERLNQI